MAYNLSGSLGAAGAGATVTWSGTSTGSTVADGSGNYSAIGVLTSGGTYTVTPTKALTNFSPASSFWPDVTQNLAGINFTASAVPKSAIVQTAVQINTTGGDTATATFANDLTAGNGLIVAVMAVDTGAAIGTDGAGTGSAAPTYVSLSDTQSNNLVTAGDGIAIYGDRTNGKTFLVGIYYMNLFSGKVKGEADAVTFTFTPLSSSANCVVGLVAYEVQGFYSNGSYSVAGTPSDTAATSIDGVNLSPGAYPGVFPPRVQGDITMTGATYGQLHIVCAAATTTDGSTFNVGSKNATDPYSEGPVGEVGWVIGGSQAANVNSTHVTLAVQTDFLTGVGAQNPVEFGTTPSGSDGIASVAAAMGFATGNTPLTGDIYEISGSLGAAGAGATVVLSGAASASTTADGSGNYSFLTLYNGAYVVTPTPPAGYRFTPASHAETVANANITGVNFTQVKIGAGSSPVFETSRFGPTISSGSIFGTRRD